MFEIPQCTNLLEHHFDIPCTLFCK
jgi:hypothetical protein